MPESKQSTTVKRAASTRKRTSAAPAAKPRTRTRRRKPTHDQIAARAYFIALDGGGDEIANWLQAERELTAAA